jgi:hypothetical protein
MNSHADAGREHAAAEPLAETVARMSLDAKIRADEAVWLTVIEARRKSPRPSLEETLAKIRHTIAEDGV